MKPKRIGKAEESKLAAFWRKQLGCAAGVSLSAAAGNGSHRKPVMAA